ncbi:MAG: methionine synthase [Anaerolineae bacterium]
MRPLEPKLLPMSVGSVPHPDPKQACDLVLRNFPQIPTWPQLPKRSFLENMYVQYSERFPGVVLEEERIYVDREQDLDEPLEALYVAYLKNDLEHGAISREYAAGLPELVSRPLPGLTAVKGQVTGPVSWGLVVVDQNRRPVLYDEILADAIAKHLRLKARWQEKQLQKLSPKVITFIDEPYMSSFGSAYVSLSREQAIGLMEEVLAGLEGIKGVHCCGNTDWSLLLATSIHILNLDAYGYAETLALYADDVKAFLNRGGIIAWGIVPASEVIYAETPEHLLERLEQAMQMLVAKGIPPDKIVEASLITPSCGTGSLSVETAEKVLATTARVSQLARQKFGVS